MPYPNDERRQSAPGRGEAADLRVLDRLQEHIPLVERPFAAVGNELGMPESWVVALAGEAKARGLIRQFSAIFDGGRLGYRTSLVAARYPADRIEEAAAFISAYPGVSHNYQRNHDFNLWYTLAVPPGTSLEGVAQVLHERTGALSTRLLPTLRRFKLAVHLDMSGRVAADARQDLEDIGQAEGEPVPAPSEAEIRAVRALQEELPITQEPFREAAEREGFANARELLRVAEGLHQRGALRRLAAILRHREAGFTVNGMVVWEAPETACEGLGRVMASFVKVTHCYQRPTYEDWPYSLFTMIHGRSAEDVKETVEAIAQATGLTHYRVLYSTAEYKKRRVRYFTNEWDLWNRELGVEAPA